jgi:hypothetical protein
MKNNTMLTIASLLSILLQTLSRAATERRFSGDLPPSLFQVFPFILQTENNRAN